MRARPTEGGRSAAPHTVARLLANPAAECSLAALSPLPREEQTCTGPNPTVVARGDRVFVVYDDIGTNETQDVFVTALDSSLGRLFRVRVNPPDRGSAQQFFPDAGGRRHDGRPLGLLVRHDLRSERDTASGSPARPRTTAGRGRRRSGAAAVPTLPIDLYSAVAGGGVYPALAARGGVAHAFWIDGRIVNLEQEVFTAALGSTPPSTGERRLPRRGHTVTPEMPMTVVGMLPCRHGHVAKPTDLAASRPSGGLPARARRG